MKLISLFLVLAAGSITLAHPGGSTPELPRVDTGGTVSTGTHDYILIPFWGRPAATGKDQWQLRLRGYALKKIGDPGYILSTASKLLGFMLGQELLDKMKARLKFAYAAIASEPLEVKQIRATNAGKTNTGWVPVADCRTNDKASFDLEMNMNLAGSGAGDWMIVSIKLSDGYDISGSVPLLGTTGWTVISDIDDTVRNTRVLDKVQALRSTFYEDVGAVPGMPQLFKYLKQTLAQGKQPASPSFAYVSASPFELYVMLKEFLKRAKFPAAAVLPSPVRLRNLLAMWRMDLRTYKRDGTLVVMEQFPERKYILVGDSGQMDPEGYGDVVRMSPHGKQVSCILIKRVTGQNEGIETVKNNAQRFALAFKDVPDTNWRVFDDAKDLLKVPFKDGGCYAPGETNTVAQEAKSSQLPECDMGKVDGGTSSIITKAEDGSAVYMRPAGTRAMPIGTVTGSPIDVCTVSSSWDLFGF